MRLRRTNDVELLKQLHAKIFPTDDAPDWDDFKNTHAGWIVWDGPTPVGFCTAKRVAGESSVFLERAGVLSGANGRGLQRRMIRVRRNWAKKIGAQVILTYTKYHNHKSIANLIREGMHFYEPERSWGGKDVHYYIQRL